MTEAQKAAGAKRKAKTAADIKAQMEKLKAELAKVEQKEHAEQLGALLVKHNVVSSINSIRTELGVDSITILSAIGKELKIARLSITQSEPKKRAPKGSKNTVQQ